MRLDWRSIVEVAEDRAREYYERYGEALTLRGLFYILVSENIIPNTTSAYKRLSDRVAKARYEGRFPWHLIRDKTRRVIWLEPSTSYPTEPLSPERLREILEEYIEGYANVSVNPWDDQPMKVIVVVEKEALGDLVATLIREVWEHGVYQVRVIRGYDSATDVKSVADEVRYISMSGKTPVVLQLGDFDPSGEDIVRDFRERVRMLAGAGEVVFEKVAVTPRQIVDLDLPAAPESLEEVEKLRRDPRYSGYLRRIRRDPLLAPLAERYGGLVRVELDALVALRPEAFKAILRNAISRYFDSRIYEEVTKPKLKQLKQRAEEVKKASLENLEKLLRGR